MSEEKNKLFSDKRSTRWYSYIKNSCREYSKMIEEQNRGWNSKELDWWYKRRSHDFSKCSDNTKKSDLPFSKDKCDLTALTARYFEHTDYILKKADSRILRSGLSFLDLGAAPGGLSQFLGEFLGANGIGIGVSLPECDGGIAMDTVAMTKLRASSITTEVQSNIVSPKGSYTLLEGDVTQFHLLLHKILNLCIPATEVAKITTEQGMNSECCNDLFDKSFEDALKCPLLHCKMPFSFINCGAVADYGQRQLQCDSFDPFEAESKWVLPWFTLLIPQLLLALALLRRVSFESNEKKGSNLMFVFGAPDSASLPLLINILKPLLREDKKTPIRSSRISVLETIHSAKPPVYVHFQNLYGTDKDFIGVMKELLRQTQDTSLKNIKYWLGEEDNALELAKDIWKNELAAPAWEDLKNIWGKKAAMLSKRIEKAEREYDFNHSHIAKRKRSDFLPKNWNIEYDVWARDVCTELYKLTKETEKLEKNGFFDDSVRDSNKNFTNRTETSHFYGPSNRTSADGRASCNGQSYLDVSLSEFTLISGCNLTLTVRKIAGTIQSHAYFSENKPRRGPVPVSLPHHVCAEAAHAVLRAAAVQLARAPAVECLESHLKYAPTGLYSLDERLGGGYRAGAITEVYGVAGSGKTQLLLAAALETAMQPCHLSKVGYYSVMMFVSEDMPTKRMHDMTIGVMKRYDMKESTPLQRLLLKEVKSARVLIDALCDTATARAIQGNNVALVIIDSVAALGDLGSTGSPKEQAAVSEITNELSTTLTAFAQRFGVAVLVSNQARARVGDVQRVPATNSGREYGPALGLRWAHTLSVRLLLERCNDSTGSCTHRTIDVIFAPSMSETKEDHHVRFTINNDGLVQI